MTGGAVPVATDQLAQLLLGLAFGQPVALAASAAGADAALDTAAVGIPGAIVGLGAAGRNAQQQGGRCRAGGGPRSGCFVLCSGARVFGASAILLCERAGRA